MKQPFFMLRSVGVFTLEQNLIMLVCNRSTLCVKSATACRSTSMMVILVCLSDLVKDPGYLNVTDLTVLVTLVVFIPLVVVGCLVTIGIVVFCVITKQRERTKRKHSRRYGMVISI